MAMQVVLKALDVLGVSRMVDDISVFKDKVSGFLYSVRSKSCFGFAHSLS